MAECDINDILCDIEVLRSLRTLRQNISTDDFKTRYPEFSDLETRLSTDIQSSERNLKDALAQCGNVDLVSEVIPSEITAGEIESPEEDDYEDYDEEYDEPED